MNPAKIQLSQEELELVQNPEWLLTKNRIIKKVYDMFGLLIDDIKALSQNYPVLFPEIFVTPPKISKGENYLGLPYVMLDYPRCFGMADTFAIRTMFWWGNFFSVTLHLKGKYKNDLLPALQKSFPVLGDHKFFLSINEDEWRHDFLLDNYAPILESEAAILSGRLAEKEFCKVAAKVGLHDWKDVPGMLVGLYEVLFKNIIPSSISYPGDGRVL